MRINDLVHITFILLCGYHFAANAFSLADTDTTPIEYVPVTTIEITCNCDDDSCTPKPAPKPEPVRGLW